MAGGTWEQTNRPVLPGLYMNFQAAASSSIQAGSRGTVVVPVKANWGPVDTFVEVSSETAIERTFAANALDNGTAYASLKLALLGGPKKLLAYRVASSAAKAATLTLKDGGGADVLQLDAKYPGDRANGFYVTIQPGVIDNTKFEVRLFEGNRMLYALLTAEITAEGLAKEINADEQNLWITAQAIGEGTGEVANVSGAAFKGGVSGNDALTNAEYITLQGALEGEQFDVLALDHAADAALLASFAAWVKRVRSEGKPVMAVFGGSTADDTSASAAQKAATRSLTLNQEGVINVGTGVRLGDAFYSSAQTSAYVAGLIAGQRLNESTTYAATPFDDVTRRWTRAEQEQAVQNGVFIFFHDGRLVKALRGVNTLVTPAAGQNNAWKKIRSIRVMDAINTDLQRSAEDTYIGKVNNTEEGRQALIGAMKAYLALLAQSNVIEAEGYDVVLDPAYYGDAPVLKPEADQVFLQWNVKLTDVMEQLFGTFYVQ
ncbi:phage tail sheath family protein [Paenibacillus polysaccharolyticus]|uniref:phage tail sheath subtilisin-like domain-containing protein n=1 Tax=Paenibacillus polysaccharolyticus TaxID=582692 RepID=UPI00209EFFA6|nr:phage tail sheath subtilisin-like domain-containing protein [Paenibacillus polysaccharolyticus]MCP1135541.1 phage tail sheath family protein [Paenibacillus polysaccharolyticus]